jgi:transcriptional regulator with XRE-family HTH domain
MVTMSNGESPLASRRRLRTELRAARLRQGLTQDQVAQTMNWSSSKMNRIEKARSSIGVDDLSALLRIYGITDGEQAEDLFALARAAGQRPWWQRYSDVAPAALLELIDYESMASAVNQFEIIFVPGILQTAEYAREVLRVFYDETSAAERLAALVDLRASRWDLLASENAPKFSFVLDESVIRRPVGNRSITSRQLRHLISVAELPDVTIQIVPFAVGLHPGMKGPFEVIRFDDTPDENVVFLESPRDDFISHAPEETRNYLEAFRHITQTALGPSDSVGRMRAAAAEMD